MHEVVSRGITGSLALLFVALLTLASCAAPPAPELEAQANVPNAFEDAAIVNVPSPTALAFTPDGRLLITSQTGQLWVYQNGALRATPALDLSARVCSNSTRGLLGIAVDPGFASNGYLYLYYTLDKDAAKRCPRSLSSQVINRVSRFSMSGSGNSVSLSSERVLVDNIPNPFGGHNAGDLHVGKDGFLYFTTGDGGCDYRGDSGCAGENDAARDNNVLLGKVVRVTRSGGIPASNPYQGTNSAHCNVSGRISAGLHCRETYASGLRNPFRMAFDPNASGTRFLINDVGQNLWEEINEGRAGADYGWNVREGRCARGSASDCGSPSGLTNPVFSYQHGSSGLFAGCSSVTGGAFVPNGLWPGMNGAYLFSDYVCGKIFKLTQTSSGYSASVFADELGNSSAVHLTFGPYAGTQALYYTSYAEGGQVRRIAYTGATNRAPTASISATPTSGSAPLSVSFDASSSRDPEGGALSYAWAFGDGSTGSGSRVTHSYTDRGDYTATLAVRDPEGAEGVATVRISVGNTPPTPRVTSPATGALFGVGDTITLRGEASDAEDGALAGSRLSWRVLQHHDDHTHPYAGPVTGSSLSIEMPEPEDLAATTTSYLEVYLTATDSGGLSRTVRQDVHPRVVAVSFGTEPSGLRLTVNGDSFVAPRTLTSWVGYSLNARAENQTTPTGQPATFASWSDGGAAAHTIVTPSAGGSYTARFSANAQSVTSFTLINAVTNTPIPGYNPIPEGATLNLARLPTRRLNIRANTVPNRVGSVRFVLGGSARTDSRAPYALRGDDNGNYTRWTPAVGSYTLRARPYTRASAQGVAGSAKTLRFRVTDSR